MKKQRRFQSDITINASNEKVWETLFTRFGEIYLYNPNLDGSHFINGSHGEVGCERRCNLDAKTSILERIISAEPNTKMAVDMYGGNMPMLERMIAEFELREVTPHRTRILFTATYTTKPAFMGSLMKPVLKKKMTDVLIGLKYYLETGKAVSKKTYPSVFTAYKQLAPSHSF